MNSARSRKPMPETKDKLEKVKCSICHTEVFKADKETVGKYPYFTARQYQTGDYICSRCEEMN